MQIRRTFNRRQVLMGMSAATLGASALLGRSARAVEEPPERRFLIVLGAAGGASIIDSFLAIRESESRTPATLNCFPDAVVHQVEGSPFRAVNLQADQTGPTPFPLHTDQLEFVRKHHQDLMVATLTCTSVNHDVAQKRSITGNDAWAGRTLQEAVATAYGDGLALPNVNMAVGSTFMTPGHDRTIPASCFPEPVVSPSTWPLSLHGSKGIAGPDQALIEKARNLRDQGLEPASIFRRIFAGNEDLERWIRLRRTQRQLETADLITKLMVRADSPKFPLAANGLQESEHAARVRERFPLYEINPLHAQAALAYLLIKTGVSVSVTLGTRAFIGEVTGELITRALEGEPGVDAPLGFDVSHGYHRSAQAVGWNQLLLVADGLIDLLKAEEYRNGESLWDRSLIYIATDFGRTKKRAPGAEEFGTSHDLNNGVVILSPQANGDRVLGGVNPDTAMTYGFDPTTGAPDPGRTMQEKEIYAGVLHTLGVDTAGTDLPDMRAMRRRA